MPNTSNDDDTRYRSREEVERWRQQDPIARLRAHLLRTGALDEATAESLEAAVSQEVEDAARWAEAQPDAEPERVLLHTWSRGPVAAPAWTRPG
jgi:TPP-dependent pyruvate/acetoin dehydrogenase alpha subunit